jgi:hypothetical protein
MKYILNIYEFFYKIDFLFLMVAFLFEIDHETFYADHQLENKYDSLEGNSF